MARDGGDGRYGPGGWGAQRMQSTDFGRSILSHAREGTLSPREAFLGKLGGMGTQIEAIQAARPMMQPAPAPAPAPAAPAAAFDPTGGLAKLLARQQQRRQAGPQWEPGGFLMQDLL